MKNVKLSVKLTGSFLVVAVITMLVGYMGVSRISLLDKSGSEIYEKNLKPLSYITNVAMIFQLEASVIRDIFLDQFIFSKDSSPHINSLKTLDQKLNENSEKFTKALTSGADRKAVDQLKSELAHFFSTRDRLINFVSLSKYADSQDLLRGEFSQIKERISALLDKLSDQQLKSIQKKMEQNSEAAAVASWFTWIFGGLGTSLAVILGFFLSISISRPIKRVADRLKERAGQVTDASAQISSASQSLADGASRQASGLEETSASLEEMSAMTKQNAENAQQAQLMMAQAGQIVGNVSHHMSKMAEAVGEITKTSEETGKIIKTIDEIAFQTNLLALNAAVEAARAGEAGAGFAVVADEVRNLAMRAAEAAKNTSTLIENTIKSIKSGHELTLLTEEAFKKNVEINEKIKLLIDEIATASREQSEGINQVSKAMSEIDQVTQKNAANAEESAAAAEELSAHALGLKEYVKDLSAVIEGGRQGLKEGSPENPGLLRPSLQLKGGSPTKSGKPALPVPAISGNKKRPALQTKNKEIPPEQVIPMEEDFKDF
jgi:methyl-accepting chemotaxis protein